MRDNELADPNSDTDAQENPEESLRARIEKLENETQEVFRKTEQRVILAELKVEAMRAGMIDLDGLTFLDFGQVHLGEDGSVADGTELIGRLKLSKPWLFATPSSSSAAKVPSSRPNRQKSATEMSDDEYRIARANIVKRSTL
jgi:hypothetical protein